VLHACWRGLSWMPAWTCLCLPSICPLTTGDGGPWDVIAGAESAGYGSLRRRSSFGDLMACIPSGPVDGLQPPGAWLSAR
jgi:hypothetical protein